MKMFWFVGALWAITVFILLFSFSNEGLSDFDANQTLITLSTQDDFESQFIEQLQSTEPDLAGKVLHFTQAKCVCNQVAKEHIVSVEILAKTHNLTNSTIEGVPDYLTPFIPSTPSVAVFDNDSKLTYLGPYSAGYSCLAGNGLVESFIKQENSSQFGATVISQVRGCYCPTTPN